MCPRVLVVGEVLWDALPSGLFLGGAPHNVACHLHRLGAEVALVSRVGDDALGREALRRITAFGLDAKHIQTDSDLPTGFVRAELDASGGATYAIEHPAAWDRIALAPEAQRVAEQSDAVVIGTLAQRDDTSRTTIRALAASGATVALDVNLRPPFGPREIVEGSLHRADIAKLNEDELDTLAAWFGLASGETDAIRALSQTFSIPTVAVTRGARGAFLLHRGETFDHPGIPAEVRDTVGAGDAFFAALLMGLLADDPPEAVLERANRLGAAVAGASGAVPMVSG